MDLSSSTASRTLRGIDRFQKTRPWLSFPVAVFTKFGEDRAGYLAGLVAYYGFFSIFPLLLVMFTVLGYVLSGSPELQEQVINSTLAQFPVIGDQMRENMGSIQGNGLVLVVGIVAALWAGMAAIRAMEFTLDAAWGVPRYERANMFVSRLRALAMLVVVGGGALVVTIVAAAGTAMTSLRASDTVLTSLFSLALASVVFLVGFKFLSTAGRPWRDHLPGAVVAAVLFVLLQLIGGIYVERVVKGAEQTYGLFAVVIGLLSWMHLQARITVFAVEINVVRAKHLWPRSIPGGEPTPVDSQLRRSTLLGGAGALDPDPPQ